MPIGKARSAAVYWRATYDISTKLSSPTIGQVDTPEAIREVILSKL